MQWADVHATLNALMEATERQIHAAIIGDADTLQALVPVQLERTGQLAQSVAAGSEAERATLSTMLRRWARRLQLLDTLCATRLAWMTQAAVPYRGAAWDSSW